MNLSFLPGDLHLKKNANGMFVVTMAGQELLSTKSQRSALAKFNSLRSELEKKFPAREPTAEEKAELLQREINDSLLGLETPLARLEPIWVSTCLMRSIRPQDSPLL